MTSSSPFVSLVALCLPYLCLGACTADDPETGDAADFALTSSAFEDGDLLPDDLKCETDGGDGASPPLSWTGAPDGTEEFALAMIHYPDGSTDDTPSHYWLLWDIPGDTGSLSRGNEDSVGHEGSNKDLVDTGYQPPCSPTGSGEHLYTISVYALDAASGLADADDLSVTWTTLMDAIDGSVLGEASIELYN